MKRLMWPLHVRRPAVVVVVLAIVAALAAVALAAKPPDLTFTPQSEGQITNIDVLRQQIKNYYGDPTASTGSSATGGWTHALNQNSNYANEARSVAKQGASWLAARSKVKKPAIVLDVDDTTLTTFNFELFSNWDFNPATQANFVGLTSGTFTGNLFPATPGMVDMVNQAKAMGYAVFFITGRGDAQHNATIANLVNDTAAGFADITSVDYSGATGLPEIDAGYVMPTAIDTGHGGFADGLFTKPAIGDYPDYLDTDEFCAAAIDAGKSCPTIQYKSGTRAYIESKGYEIVGNFGDQFSDLIGGHADKTFKMPNPNYFLP